MLRFGIVFDHFGAETIENSDETIKIGAETIENGAEKIENGAETKHLNSTRTARPPRAWQVESNSNATEKMASCRWTDVKTSTCVWPTIRWHAQGWSWN